MNELIDMLRTMAGACKAIAIGHPTGFAQATSHVVNGNLPGIRVGVDNGVMIRIVLEKENNLQNKEALEMQHTWVDPSHDGEFR